MIKSSITISNKLGLHARASAKWTQLAGTFDCDIHLARAGRRINAKSIMGVMMLAAARGANLVIDVDGPDEDAALAALLDLVGSGFGEGVSPADPPER